jgi:glycerophosphoryl diester phosphodiesterase
MSRIQTATTALLTLCIAFGQLCASPSNAAESKDPKIYAHRGGAKWAPENTMAAFRKCKENGVYGIELDIQRCKTG